MERSGSSPRPLARDKLRGAGERVPNVPEGALENYLNSETSNLDKSQKMKLFSWYATKPSGSVIQVVC